MKVRNETSWGELLKTSLAVIRVSSSRISSGVRSTSAAVETDVMSRTSAGGRIVRGPPTTPFKYEAHRGRAAIPGATTLAELTRSPAALGIIACNKFLPCGRVRDRRDAAEGR